MFDPEKFQQVWGDDLAAGLAGRDPTLGPLQISAGGMVAIGDEYAGDGADACSTWPGPQMALYVGGMGARDKNFYNTICQKYGYVERRRRRCRISTCRAPRGGGGRRAAGSCSPGCNLVGSAGERRASASPRTRRPG